MSYSRWSSRGENGRGSGHWYTYWHCHPGEDWDGGTRDNALFDVCSVAMFTAKQLREDLDGCLLIVSLKDQKADKSRLDELKIYISEFLNDVDEAFKDSVS